MEQGSVRELNLRDFEGIELDPNCFQIDWLAAIANRALAILDQEEHWKKMEKDKRNQKLSDSGHPEEHEEKGRRKLHDSDLLDEKPRKKMKLEEERNRETLQPKFSSEVCLKEFSERVIRETDQPRLSKGVCIRECSERVIRRDQQHKKKEDSFPFPEGIFRRRRLPKKPTAETETDREYQENRKVKKIGKKSDINHGPNPPPPLPEAFREALQQLAQGKPIRDLNLVIQKALYSTDVSTVHNRLSLPSRDLLYGFLSEEEIQELSLYNGKNVKTIEADIIEPSLERGKVSFRRWVMRKNSGNESVSYVFTKTWNSMVSRNSLVERDVVQVWSARVEEQLCFLLVRIQREEEKEPSSNGHDAESTKTKTQDPNCEDR